MIDLDNPKTCGAYDPSGVLGLIAAFPEQAIDAKNIASAFRLPAGFPTAFRNVTVTGLGGSAIGADIVRSYIAGEAVVPVAVNRNYSLPKFVDSSSLVVASSYSGDTEETLSAYSDARAKKAVIVAITTGGRLKEMAAKDGVPCLIIPKGLPPRCALGYSFFTLLLLFSKMGLVSDKSADIDAAIKLMSQMRDQSLGQNVPRKDNIAKLIALQLYGKFPVIYAAQDHIDSVATRWRGQIEENAKTIASMHLFPEMNHNEIMGWENPKKVIGGFCAILLRDSGDHPRIARRIDITKKMIESSGVKVLEVRSLGKGLLSRIFSLIYTGDYVSYYLAILNEADPMSIDRINYLKKELAKS